MTELRPDLGLLQAYLDGELAPNQATDVERRLRSDQALAGELATLRSAGDAVTKALERMDAPPRWPAASQRPWRTPGGEMSEKNNGPAGFVSGPATTHRAPRIPRAAIRAAVAILALGAGAVSALPGSPVRRWLGEGDREEPVESTLAGDAASAVPDVARVRPGIRVPSALGRLTVALPSMAPDQELVVSLSEAASTWVWAGEGAGYTTSPGRLEVTTPSAMVEIALPRNLPEAVIEVGGEIYLRKIFTELRLSGPVSDSTQDRVRFRIDGSRSDRTPRDSSG